jgi:hypothetical protein
MTSRLILLLWIFACSLALALAILHISTVMQPVIAALERSR